MHLLCNITQLFHWHTFLMASLCKCYCLCVTFYFLFPVHLFQWRLLKTCTGIEDTGLFPPASGWIFTGRTCLNYHWWNRKGEASLIKVCNLYAHRNAKHMQSILVFKILWRYLIKCIEPELKLNLILKRTSLQAPLID